MKICKICEDEFEPIYNSTQRVCGWPCGLVDAQNKTKKKVDAKHAKHKKEFKLNDTPHQHRLTQPVFNRMRVLQETAYYQRMEKEPECISCGLTNTVFNGGHFKSVGARSEHRYDPKNVHLQCVPCNQHKSGNPAEYAKGLARRYGSHEAFLIIDKFEQHKIRKWTGPELFAMRKKFNKNIRELT